MIFPGFHWKLRIIKAASDVIAEHFDQYEVEDLRPGTGSGKAEWCFHILKRERHAVRREKIRNDEKSGVLALQTHCVSSCKFWRSASCYSEALTAQHTCTDSTQRRHFHYAWKRGMACIMDVPWCSWACLDVIPEIATKGLGDWTKVLYGCYVLHRDNKRDLQIQGLICDCKLNSCDLEYADSTAKHSGHVFSSIIDRCLTRGSTVGRHAIWAQFPLLSQYKQSCITV